MYCNVTRRIQAGLDKTWEEAAFAGIRADAVLTQISEGLLLLQPDTLDTPDPRKGTLIRAEF